MCHLDRCKAVAIWTRQRPNDRRLSSTSSGISSLGRPLSPFLSTFGPTSEYRARSVHFEGLLPIHCLCKCWKFLAISFITFLVSERNRKLNMVWSASIVYSSLIWTASRQSRSLVSHNASHSCQLQLQRIVQFRIRHDRWIKALTTHFYRVSLDLKKIFINTSGKVTQIWILNNTQSCKQVIFSLEFVNILL